METTCCANHVEDKSGRVFAFDVAIVCWYMAPAAQSWPDSIYGEMLVSQS